MIRTCLLLIVCLFAANASAQVPSPGFYERHVDPVAGMSPIEISSVPPAWVVNQADEGFRIYGHKSGELTHLFEVSLSGQILSLTPVDVDLLNAGVQPTDWIVVNIDPSITQGKSFVWQFISDGSSYFELNSTTDVVEVREAPGSGANPLTISEVVDLNNDHLADLLLVVGDELVLYEATTCPGEGAPGEIHTLKQTISGIIDTNGDRRFYQIFIRTLNDDDLPDLLLFARRNQDECYVLYNTSTLVGGLSFADPQTIDFIDPIDDGGMIHQVEMADLTGDGIEDVLILRQTELTLYPGLGLSDDPTLLFDIHHGDAADPYTITHTDMLPAFAAVDIVGDDGNRGQDGVLELFVTYYQEPVALNYPAWAKVWFWDADLTSLVEMPEDYSLGSFSDEAIFQGFLNFGAQFGLQGPELLKYESPGAHLGFFNYQLAGNPFDVRDPYLPVVDARHTVMSAPMLGASFPGVTYFDRESESVVHQYGYFVNGSHTMGLDETNLAEFADFSTGDFDGDGDEDLVVFHMEDDDTWEFHYLLDEGRWSIPTGLRFAQTDPAWQNQDRINKRFAFDSICVGDTSFLQIDVTLDALDNIAEASITQFHVTSDGDDEFPDTSEFHITQVLVEGVAVPEPTSLAPLTLALGETATVILAFTDGTATVAGAYQAKFRSVWSALNSEGVTCWWDDVYKLQGQSMAAGLGWAKIRSDGSAYDLIAADNVYDFEGCPDNSFDPADGCPEDISDAGCIQEEFRITNNDLMPALLTNLIVEQVEPLRDDLIPFCLGPVEGNELPTSDDPVVLGAGESYDFYLYFCPEPGVDGSIIYPPGEYDNPQPGDYFLYAEFDSCGTQWNHETWTHQDNILRLGGEVTCVCPVVDFTSHENPAYEYLASVSYDQATDDVTFCDPTAQPQHRFQLEFGSMYVPDGASRRDLVIRDIYITAGNEAGDLGTPIYEDAFCFTNITGTPIYDQLPMHLGPNNYTTIKSIFSPEETLNFPCGLTSMFVVVEFGACGEGDGDWSPDDDPAWVPQYVWWPIDVTYTCDPALACLDFEDVTEYDQPENLPCSSLEFVGPDSVYVNREGSFVDFCAPDFKTLCFDLYNDSIFAHTIEDETDPYLNEFFELTGDPEFQFVFPIEIPANDSCFLHIEFSGTSTSTTPERKSAQLSIRGGPVCPDPQIARNLTGFLYCPLLYPVLYETDGLLVEPGDDPGFSHDFGTYCRVELLDCSPELAEESLIWTAYLENDPVFSQGVLTLNDVVKNDADDLGFELWYDEDEQGVWLPWVSGSSTVSLEIGEHLPLMAVGCWESGCEEFIIDNGFTLIFDEARFETEQFEDATEPFAFDVRAVTDCDALVEIAQPDQINPLIFSICGSRPEGENVCNPAYNADIQELQLLNACDYDVTISSYELSGTLTSAFCVTILDDAIPHDLANLQDNVRIEFRPLVGLETLFAGSLTLHLVGEGPDPIDDLVVTIVAPANHWTYGWEDGVEPDFALPQDYTFADTVCANPDAPGATWDLDLFDGCLPHFVQLGSHTALEDGSNFQFTIHDPNLDGQGDGGLEMSVVFRPAVGTPSGLVNDVLHLEFINAADGSALGVADINLAGSARAFDIGLFPFGPFDTVCATRPPGESDYGSYAFDSVDLNFFDDCDPNFLVIDFGGITFSGQSIEQFMVELLQANIDDAADGVSELRVVFAPDMDHEGVQNAVMSVPIRHLSDNTLLTTLQIDLEGTSSVQPLPVMTYVLPGPDPDTLAYCPFRMDDTPSGIVFEVLLQAGPVEIEALALIFNVNPVFGSAELLDELPASMIADEEILLRAYFSPFGSLGEIDICEGNLEDTINMSLSWEACGGPAQITPGHFTVQYVCEMPEIVLVDPILDFGNTCPYPDLLELYDDLSFMIQGDTLLSQAVEVNFTTWVFPGELSPLNWQLSAFEWDFQWLPADPEAVTSLTCRLRLWPQANQTFSGDYSGDFVAVCGDNTLELEYTLNFTRECNTPPLVAPEAPLSTCGVLDQLVDPVEFSDCEESEWPLRFEMDPACELPLEILSFAFVSSEGDTLHEWRGEYFNPDSNVEPEYTGVQALYQLPTFETDPIVEVNESIDFPLDVCFAGFWPDYQIYPTDQTAALDVFNLVMEYRPPYVEESSYAIYPLTVERSCDFPSMQMTETLLFEESACEAIVSSILTIQNENQSASLTTWLSIEEDTTEAYHFNEIGTITQIDELVIDSEENISVWFTVPDEAIYDVNAEIRVVSNQPESHFRFFGTPVVVDLVSHKEMTEPVAPHEVLLELVDPRCTDEANGIFIFEDSPLVIAGWDCRPARFELSSNLNNDFDLQMALGECNTYDHDLEVDEFDAFDFCFQVTRTNPNLMMDDLELLQYTLTMYDEDGGEVLDDPIDLLFEVRPCDVSLELSFIDEDELMAAPWGHQLWVPVQVEIEGRSFEGPLEIEYSMDLLVSESGIDLHETGTWTALAVGAIAPEGTVLQDTLIFILEGAGDAEVCLNYADLPNMNFDWVIKSPEDSPCVSNNTNVLPFALQRNAFTPNGDGRNDEVCFNFQRGYDLSRMKVEVFSLSGVKLFSQVPTMGEPIVCWDGKTRSGESLLPGPYIYAIWINGDVEHRGQILMVK